MIAIMSRYVADSSSGIGALGIDTKALIIQLVTFVLAFWVLKRFAFGPIIKLMNTRRETIEQGVNLGEKMKRDEAELAAKVSSELAKARREADSIIAGAEATSRDVARQSESKALEKADSIIADAKERAEQEVVRARKQLEKELVGLISDATETIIGEKVDASKDAKLIDRALKDRQTA